MDHLTNDRRVALAKGRTVEKDIEKFARNEKKFNDSKEEYHRWVNTCLEIINIAVKGSAHDIYPIARAVMKYQYSYFTKLAKISESIQSSAISLEKHKIHVSVFFSPYL